MTVDTVSNVLRCPHMGWEIPLCRKYGHVYLEWSLIHNNLFTKNELIKLHRGFQHPPDEKLLNLIKRARPSECTEETTNMLRRVSENCDTCQRISQAPMRFKVTLPSEKDLVFGEELSMDLMFIDRNAILHVLDTATRFSSATFLDSNGSEYGQTAYGVWLAFLECWCTLYTGYPNRLRTDYGSIFTSPKWKELTNENGIQLRISGIEAHNSLGIGERLHDPLRRIYRKIRKNATGTNQQTALRLTLKAMNDTMGENGLVPSLLVFGIIPRFPVISSQLPAQSERMEVLTMAQREMNTIIAQRRIITALTKNIPSASDRFYSIDDEVLVYREKEKEWVGPYRVVFIDGKMITMQNPERTYEGTFSSQQIKPYLRDEGTEEKRPDSLSVLYQMLKPFRLSPESGSQEHSVHITEIIKPGDPRESEFDDAKREEIQGLIERGTWEIVPKSSVQEGANILRGRFVLTIKDVGTDKQRRKARYVVQGYRDRMKTSLVHDTSTAKQSSVKILVGISAIYGFRIFSIDVTQAYLQSSENLKREIYVKPSREFKLHDGELLKLRKPLYGLPDSGDYWGRTISDHLTNVLGMKKTIGDEAFFYKLRNNSLHGLCVTYVDDLPVSYTHLTLPTIA